MFRSLGRKSGAKALSDAEMAAPGSSGKKSSKRDKKEKSRSLALRNKGDVEALEREAQAKWGDDFSSNAAADVEKTDVVDSDGLEKLTGYARKFASAIKDLNSAFPVRDADGKSKVLRAMQNVQTCIREVGSQFQVSSGPPLRRGKKLVDMIKAWDVEQEPLKPREFQKACDELVETYTRVVSECLIGFNSGLSMDLDDELDAYGEDRDIAGYLLQDAVIVLNRRCKEWSKYVGEIIKYLKDRVGHEKDYYAAMTKIARLSADAMSEKGGAVATGSFHNAMSIVLRTHENQAQKRADFTINVLQTVIDVLHLKRTDHDKSRKLLKEQFVEQEKKLHKALKALESARSSYHSASNNWEKAALAKDREESAGTDAKIEKRAKDEETARRSAADADDAYRAQLAATNKTITEFEAYYKTTLRDYKRLNEDCEEATKTAIMKFLELERDLYTPFAGRLSDVMVTGSKIDHVRDVAEYVRVESEGNALSHPIHEYEEYQMSRQAANYLGLDSIRKPPPSFAPSKKEPAKVSKPKKNLFGHPLDDITAMSPNNVPQVIVSCVSEIEKRGMDCIGIYRMAGVKSQIENLCNDFDAGRMIDLGALIDMHVLGSVVKLFFRQMPEPLIAYDVYEKLIGSGKETSPSFLRQTLKELPTRNLATLEYLIEHLERVASKSGVNKMKEENLGIVFGPTLMKARNENNFNSLMEMPKQVQIVTTLISNFNTVFRTQPPAPNSPTVAPVGGVAMAGAADVGLRKSPPPTSKKPVVSPPASHPKASPPVIAPPAAVRGPDPVMMHDAASRQGSTEEDRVAVEEARRRAQAAMTEFGSGMNNGAPTLTLGSTVTAPPRVPEETRDEQSKSEPPTTKAKPAKRRPFLARGMMAESSDEEEDEDPAAAEAAASAAFAERQREAELAKARRVEEEERERAAALEKQKQREHEEQERARKEREEAEQRKAAREERERKQREDEERAAAAARAEQEAQENRKRQASLRAEDRQARLRDLQRKREGKTSDDEADQQHQHAPLSSTASSGSAGVPAEQVDPALAAQASEADRVAREAAEVAAKAKKQLADTPRPPDELKQCVCNKKARFRCTICRQQFYCSKECQTSDWPTHKGGCSKPNPEQLAAMKQREEERKKALARYEELSKSIAPLQAAADAAEADARRVNSELETSRREAAAKQQQSHAAEEEKRRRAHEQQQQQQREAEERAAADARKRQQEEAEAARQREAQEQQQAALRAQQQAAAARARAEEEEAARQKEEEEASSQAAAAAAMAAQQAAAARARAEAAQAAEAEKRRREEEEAAAQQSSAEQARQQAAAAAQAQAAAAAAAAQRAQAEQAEAKAKAEAEAKAKADTEAAAKAQAEAAAKAQAEAAAKAQAEAAAAQAQAAAAAAQAQAAAAVAQAQAAATASAAPPAAAPAAAGADEQLPVALYDYTARTENEVSFQRGDPIRVFQQVNADWLHGEVRGANGYIPCKYVSGY